MWPDNETTQDLLGFRVHADLIRAVVMNPRMLPTTIGVFGDWGGGKTSVMRMLEQDLAQIDDVAVVYVNTWLFEGYDDAKSALLSSVLAELAQHKRFGPKVRDKVRSLIRTVKWMRVVRFGWQHLALPAAAAYLTAGAAAIPAAIGGSLGLSQLAKGEPQEEDESEDKDSPDGEGFLKADVPSEEEMDVRTFRERFTTLLKDGGIKTLIVLVDDLDRCTPERIIDNLEAVKLFLSVDQTAFVIGADRRIVEHAIRARYAATAIDDASRQESDQLVKDYLEKLVQIPYALPRLSSSEIETYMALLFCSQHQDETAFAKCLSACDDLRAKNRYSSFGFSAIQAAGNGQPLPQGLGEALGMSASVAVIIADRLKGNPRQVKRFLNAFLLRKELSRVARLDNIRDVVLVKLMILEYVHPEQFNQLFQWQSHQSGHPKELNQLEAILASAKGNVDDEAGAAKIAQGWATSQLRQWIAMEPLLADVDLRDYFWVARDRLATTFSGISMVPPIVRTVLEGLTSSVIPKRNSAMKAAKDLSADERASLFQLIEQRISRQPGDQLGYDAFRFLLEADVPGAAESLAKVLLNQSPEAIPPAVGMHLGTLIKGKPQLASALNAAQQHLAKPDTPIGRAIESSKPARKRG